MSDPIQEQPRGDGTDDPLVVDAYGNTEADPFEFCTFPDCGCDGERLCQARSGANAAARRCNCEGMYQRGDKIAMKAKFDLIALVHNKVLTGTEPAAGSGYGGANGSPGGSR